MTDTPLTERLEWRAEALPDDGGYHHSTRLLLREAAAALEAASARAQMLERRADATQAENEALVALLEAAEARVKELGKARARLQDALTQLDHALEHAHQGDLENALRVGYAALQARDAADTCRKLYLRLDRRGEEPDAE